MDLLPIVIVILVIIAVYLVNKKEGMNENSTIMKKYLKHVCNEHPNLCTESSDVSNLGGILAFIHMEPTLCSQDSAYCVNGKINRKELINNEKETHKAMCNSNPQFCKNNMLSLDTIQTEVESKYKKDFCNFAPNYCINGDLNKTMINE